MSARGSFPWGPAVATGVGSVPGDNSREAARVVAGELPDFLHLPEMPSRGPGSDMIGRTGALLAMVSDDFGLETTPDAWRITAGRGRTMRRAMSWLDEDLDALEEESQGYSGPLKVQIVGPWTMAASIELPFGERMLKDPGACRDLADALAEAARLHVTDLERRFPRSAFVLQWDEPAITTVLEGSIGTASGMSRYAAVEPPIAEARLRTVLQAVPRDTVMAGIHCCAVRPPIDMFVSSGAKFVSIDLLNGAVDEDSLGQAWEDGIGILAGSVPSAGSIASSGYMPSSTSDSEGGAPPRGSRRPSESARAAGVDDAPSRSGPRGSGSSSGGGRRGSGGGRTAPSSGISDVEASRPVRLLASRLGLNDAQLLGGIVITPTCGLAGASPAWARAALAACKSAGRVLRGDNVEDDERS